MSENTKLTEDNSLKKNKQILVFVKNKNELHSLEGISVLKEAALLSEKINAGILLVVFDDIEDEIKDIYGKIDHILVIQNKKLKEFDSMGYSFYLEKVIHKYSADLSLLPSTDFNNDIASIISAKMQMPAIVNGAQPDYDTMHKEWTVIQPDYEGKFMIKHHCRSSVPVVMTLKRRVFEEGINNSMFDAGFKGKLSRWICIDETGDGLQMLQERKKSESCDTDISSAAGIVAGGRGIGGKAGLELLEQLAELIHAHVGSSRPNVDDGLIGKEHQIGLSGTVVSPQYYIACGISGAAHHIMGMEQSQWVMALNIDRNEPIFDYADVGIIGDSKTVLGLLIEKIKEYQNNGC